MFPPDDKEKEPPRDKVTPSLHSEPVAQWFLFQISWLVTLIFSLSILPLVIPNLLIGLGTGIYITKGIEITTTSDLKMAYILRFFKPPIHVGHQAELYIIWLYLFIYKLLSSSFKIQQQARWCLKRIPANKRDITRQVLKKPPIRQIERASFMPHFQPSSGLIQRSYLRAGRPLNAGYT